MRLAVNIVLFLATLLVAGTVLDGWLQLAEIQSPLETYVDEEYGPLYLPNRDFSRFNEGFFLGGTNQWRTLGEGRPPRNDNGELRVVLVGDSYVLGHTVFERHHFKRVLEHDLEQALGRSITVLNFARADLNLWNMHRYYRDFVCRWDFDLAIFFVSAGDLVPSLQVGRSLYPISVASAEGLVADYSFRQSSLYRWTRLTTPVLTRVATLRMVFNAYKLRLLGRYPSIFFDKLGPLVAGLTRKDSHVREAKALPPLPENSLAILRDLAADRKVALVYKAGVDEAYKTQIDTIMTSILDLESVYDDLEERGIEPTYWPVTGQYGHWNHATHRAIGHALANAVLGAELLAGR